MHAHISMEHWMCKVNEQKNNILNRNKWTEISTNKKNIAHSLRTITHLISKSFHDENTYKIE